jgi:hypothetical protein
MEEAMPTKDERVKVVWRKGFPCRGVDPEAAAKEHDRLTKMLGHQPTADDLLESAKSQQSPYRPIVYDCSTKVAAFRYRRMRAASALAALEVVYERKESDGETKMITVPYSFSYVSPEERCKGVLARRSWVNPEVAKDDPELRVLLVQQALVELERWRDRYENIAEFMGLHKAIDKVVKQHKKVVKQAEATA